MMVTIKIAQPTFVLYVIHHVNIAMRAQVLIVPNVMQLIIVNSMAHNANVCRITMSIRAHALTVIIYAVSVSGVLNTTAVNAIVDMC
jgi:hypothetical protein